MDSQPHLRRVALLSLHSSPLAHPGGGNAGGMNLYVKRLSQELTALGLDVDIFTRRADTSSPDVVRLPEGPRIVHLSAGPARPLGKSSLPLHVPRLIAGLRDYMERTATRYDLFHSHYWLSGMVAIRARPDADVPVAHMFHTLAKVKEAFTGSPDRADSSVRPDGERCVISGADAVIGCTWAELDLMERLYGRTPRQFAVIPPGVDTTVFYPREREKSRQLIGIRSTDRVILFAGRLEPLKGLHTLLHSLAQIRPRIAGSVSLVVVGDGAGRGPGSEAQYRQMARRLGLEDIVRFEGLIPQERMPIYYSAADVCAVPSAYESFGMAAAEAMACGTSVVAFGVGGPAATIRDGVTGFLSAPGSIDDFGSKLHEALAFGALDAMGRRARVSVQKFAWHTIARQTLDLYNDLVQERAYPYMRASNAR